MKICNRCKAGGLVWVNVGSQDKPKWKLANQDGTIHECSKQHKDKERKAYWAKRKAEERSALGAPVDGNLITLPDGTIVDKETGEIVVDLEN